MLLGSRNVRVTTPRHRRKRRARALLFRPNARCIRAPPRAPELAIPTHSPDNGLSHFLTEHSDGPLPEETCPRERNPFFSYRAEPAGRLAHGRDRKRSGVARAATHRMAPRRARSRAVCPRNRRTAPSGLARRLSRSPAARVIIATDGSAGSGGCPDRVLSRPRDRPPRTVPRRPDPRTRSRGAL